MQWPRERSRLRERPELQARGGEYKLLEALRTELLSKDSIAEYKARAVKRLRRPAIDTSKVRKVEAEIANLVQGRRRRYPLSIACGMVGSLRRSSASSAA